MNGWRHGTLLLHTCHKSRGLGCSLSVLLPLMANSNVRQAQFRSAIGESGQEEEEKEGQEVVVHLLTTESPSREPERRQQ